MLIRVPIAMVLGVGFWMLTLVLTDYDGFMTVAIAPLFAAFFTGIVMTVLFLIGSPLLLPKVWPVWRKHWYVALAIIILGVLAMIASWLPSLRVQQWNPEAQHMFERPHAILGMGGWLAMLFGTLYFPRFGLSPSKKWA